MDDAHHWRSLKQETHSLIHLLLSALEARHRGHRRHPVPLVPMLLNGGCGYEELRPVPPLRRSTVGFDRLIDLIDDSVRWEGEDHYPPYDIVRTGEDAYRITLAVAGFKPEEIGITAQRNLMTVTRPQGRPRVPVPGHLRTAVPAMLQPRGLRGGQGRVVRQWAVADRPGARGAGGDEATTDRDRIRGTQADFGVASSVNVRAPLRTPAGVLPAGRARP